MLYIGLYFRLGESRLFKLSPMNALIFRMEHFVLKIKKGKKNNYKSQ